MIVPNLNTELREMPYYTKSIYFGVMFTNMLEW